MALCLGTLPACDQAHTVELQNATGLPVTVTATVTRDFETLGGVAMEELAKSGDGREVRFANPAAQSVEVGMVIGDLYSELPFTRVAFSKSGSPLAADGVAEVLDMFETDNTGQIKTPYRIVIK